MQPEVNRALARELYVDSLVNVVNPSAKKGTGGKVIPGQMNLFNPSGKDIKLSPRKGEASPRKLQQEASPDITHRSGYDQIQSIITDDGGKGKMRNPDLQQKTEAIQKEFE